MKRLHQAQGTANNVCAAYGSVDWVMSGVMETRDRWLVADNPVSFDSDYMVFVAPPPAEISKATSPTKPFTQEVTLKTVFLHAQPPLDVVAGNPDCAGVRGEPGGDGLHDADDWEWGGR